MSQKILVVDDDEEITRVVQITLEAKGYRVETARNGQLALQAVARDMPDVSVLDVEMPEMDGMTTLRNLKENEATGAIPVIMLTGKDQVDDIAHGWENGADFYWTKPFSAIQLAVLIKRILDERGGN